MTTRVYIDPEKTQHFKHLLNMEVTDENAGFAYCHMEGLHLRVKVDQDERRKARGLGYRIELPGSLPYFLPHWLFGAVTYVEARVPVYDPHEVVGFLAPPAAVRCAFSVGIPTECRVRSAYGVAA